MDILLNEIKKLAKNGYEEAIISNELKSKDTFLNILLKAEIALNNTNKIKDFEKPNTKNPDRTYEKIEDNIKKDMYLVAYCFSYYEHTSLYPQYTQDKAFNIAAEKLGIKKNTLKNTRDWFDGHNDNDRSSWWQAPLPDDMQQFKNMYENKNKTDVVLEARKILGIEG